MIIRCWGSRGSLPVSGKEYIKYGGDTTCLEIRTKSNDIIIVDAGTGIRRLGNHLAKQKRHAYHFIFTHAHWDHLMGFPFFKPLYSNRTRIHMHRCPFHSKFVETILSKVMAPPNFPVKYSDITATLTHQNACPNTFEIGSMQIIPIAISHPNGGSGYKFIENGNTFIFLTDNELGFMHPGGRPFIDYIKFCEGADLLLHDAEYTSNEYRRFIEWGHSKYPDTLKLARQAQVKQLGLFHLNQERTDRQMDEIVAKCRKQIRAQNSGFECFAVGRDWEVEL